MKNSTDVLKVLICPTMWLVVGIFDGIRTIPEPFTISFSYLYDSVNFRPVCSLILSSHFFCCLPTFLCYLQFIWVLYYRSPNEEETIPYHLDFLVFTVARSSPNGSIVSRIFFTSLIENVFKILRYPLGFYLLRSSAFLPILTSILQYWDIEGGEVLSLSKVFLPFNERILIFVLKQ